MRRNLRYGLVAIWLLLSALLAVVLFTASRFVLERAVVDSVSEHLSLTLDESLFGTTQNRGNDQEGLQRVGQQLNVDLRQLVISHWYSPLQNCVVQLHRIDDVVPGGEAGDATPDHTLSVKLLRNQIDREIVIGLTCSNNWWVAGAAGVFLGVLFLAIGCAIPPPLSKIHRQWINYLLERGYTGTQAFDLIRGYDASELSVNTTQRALLDRLHDRSQRNFADAMQVVIDPRVAALDDVAIDWLMLGLQREPGNLDRALALACGQDEVVIDLAAMTLSIRGLSVPTSGTPLFYYAWYARSRMDGEGWITNPASNRPDREAAAQLVELMSRFDGHARAINDLERAGLKARTLDQNRSKIKDEIVAVLGEHLADAYLFEASRHPDDVHTRYRLRVHGRCIRILDTD